MNEEIEKQIDQKVDDIFMDNDGCYWGVDYDRVSSIKETMYELYLLGVQDMWEAVKMERVPRATLKKAKPYEQIFDQSTGWDMAVAEQQRKAQQFIDSLEGKE